MTDRTVLYSTGIAILKEKQFLKIFTYIYCFWVKFIQYQKTSLQ